MKSKLSILVEKKCRNDNFKFADEKKMNKITFVLSIIFVILTFVGAGYVLPNHGQVNAGYAYVPTVIVLASVAAYRKKR